MKKKGGSVASAEKNDKAAGGTTATVLWNFLKKCDDEGMEKLLQQCMVGEGANSKATASSSTTMKQLVNCPNSKKMLPLSYAVSHGMSERGLLALLRAGSEIDAVDDTTERATALHAACWGEDDATALLLLRCGANPLVTDSQGRTPLHVLASLNAVSLFSSVISTVTQAGADSAGVNDSNEDNGDDQQMLVGRTPVTVSFDKLLGSKDKAGFTVLHTAVSDISAGSDGVVGELLGYLEVMAKTEKEKVSQLVNMKTESGSSALHLILSWPDCNHGVVMRIVERLLNLGAAASAADTLGQTPLTVVVTTHADAFAAKVVCLLLQSIQKEETDSETHLRRAFMECDEQEGFTLVHHAVAVNATEVVKVLINFLRGLDESDGSQYLRQWLGGMLTNANKSVIQLVVERGSTEIADALIEAQVVSRAEYEKHRKEHEDAQRKEEEELRKREQLGVGRESEDGDEEEEEEEERDLPGGAPSHSAAGGASKTSRVQQARKARAQAMAQRKKNAHKLISEATTQQLDALPQWVKIGAALLLVSTALLIVSVLPIRS